MQPAPEFNSDAEIFRLRLEDFFAIGYIVFVFIPQATLFGRAALAGGFFILWLLASWGPRHKLTQMACLPMAVALVLQIAIYFLKCSASQSFHFLSQVSVGFITIFLSLYICAHYVIHHRRRYVTVKTWSLVLIALSISYAILVAIDQPGIMRQLIFREESEVSHLRLLGVPSYSLIYSVAMCFFVFVGMLGRHSGLTRLSFGVALGIFAIHVALSTLTLPTTLLALIALFWSLHIVFTKTIMVIRLAVPALVLGVCLFIVFSSSSAEDFGAIPQIEQTIAKVQRLITGITEYGLSEGDETRRGAMMSHTIETFLENPILGRSFSEDAVGEIGGHSSLIDPLAMFGAFGYLPMVLFHFLLIRNSVKQRWNETGKNQWRPAEVLAWCFYGLASFWNPTTFTVLPYAIVFLTVVQVPDRFVAEFDNAEAISKQPFPPTF